jgi:RES domain-containing protein
MSVEIDTAFAEYHQDIQRPGTLCRFDVDAGPVVDLRDMKALQALGAARADLMCAWKEIHFIHKKTPSTWRISDQLIAAGVSGILVPSAQRLGGTNLVLWHWNDCADRKVVAYDPQGDLPKNQTSWT